LPASKACWQSVVYVAAATGEAARHVARGQKITGIFACYFFALLSLLQNYESMDFKFWNLIHWIIKF
jgi:hypothetical protein